MSEQQQVDEEVVSKVGQGDLDELFGNKVVVGPEGPQTTGQPDQSVEQPSAQTEQRSPEQIIAAARVAIAEANQLVITPEQVVAQANPEATAEVEAKDPREVIRLGSELRVRGESVTALIKQLESLDEETLGQEGAARLEELKKTSFEISETKEAVKEVVGDALSQLRDDLLKGLDTEFGKALVAAENEEQIQELTEKYGLNLQLDKIKSFIESSVGITALGVGELMRLMAQESSVSEFVAWLLYGSGGTLGASGFGKEAGQGQSINEAQFVGRAKNPLQMADSLIKAYDESLRVGGWNLTTDKITRLRDAVGKEDIEILRELLVDLSKFIEDSPQQEEQTKHWEIVSKALGSQFGKDKTLDETVREYLKKQAKEQKPWNEVWPEKTS